MEATAAQRPVHKGDKVHVLLERGSMAKGDQRLWVVKKIGKAGGVRVACLELLANKARETKRNAADIAKPNSTPETIDPSKLSLRLNKMYDSGRLQQAVGDDVAETLLQHSDSAERAGR